MSEVGRHTLHDYYGYEGGTWFLIRGLRETIKVSFSFRFERGGVRGISTSRFRGVHPESKFLLDGVVVPAGFEGDRQT